MRNSLRDNSGKWQRALKLKKKGQLRQAYIHFLHLVNQGELPAYLEIAELLRMPAKQNSKGVAIDDWQQDYAEALQWYQKLIHQAGDDYAYLGAGELYFHGLGVEQSSKKALRYFKTINDQSILKKNLYLANCYEFGLGVEQSEKRAAVYYRKAAKQGNLPAKKIFAQYQWKSNKKIASLLSRCGHISGKILTMFNSNKSPEKFVVVT